MSIEVRAHQLRRGDVLVDGITPALITAVTPADPVGGTPYVLITARLLDPELDEGGFDFTEPHRSPRLIADTKWAG